MMKKQKVTKTKPSNFNHGIRLMRDFFMKTQMMMKQKRKLMPIKSTSQERLQLKIMTVKFPSIMNQTNQTICNGMILLNKSISRPMMRKNFSSPYSRETFLRMNRMKFSQTFKLPSHHRHQEIITEDLEQ